MQLKRKEFVNFAGCRNQRGQELQYEITNYNSIV